MLPPLPIPGAQTPTAFTPPAAAPAAPPALDPTIVNLAKAIRQTETRGQKDPYTAQGASGEYGAYQYTQGTWDADAKKYLGTSVPLTSATREQQNEVAYKKIADLKAAGNNVGQIASIWNSGSPEWKGKVGVNSKGVKYDVPQYVDSVSNAYQSLKANQTPTNADTASTVGNEQVVTPDQQKDAASAAQTGAFFPAVTGDSPLSAGLKTAGNLPSSAFNFAKGAISSLNPVNTINTASQIPGAFGSLVQESGGVLPALEATAKEIPGAAYNALVPQFGKDLVSAAGGFFSGNSKQTDEGLSAAQRDVTNDPVGSIAPFVLAAQAGAKALDKAGITTDASGALDTAMSKTASVVTKPVGYAFGKAADIGAATVKYGTAKFTGFNPDTISQIVEDPSKFSPEEMAQSSRALLGNEIATKLGDRIDAKSETGASYADVRNSTAPVQVDPAFLSDALTKESGLDFADGKFSANAKSLIDKPGDVAAIQRLYDSWQPYFDKGTMTPDDFLTLRSKLAKIAYNDAGIRSGDMASVGNGARVALNAEYRDQIQGLSEKDADFSSQATELKTLSKGILDKDGNLTDAAINRIANAAGKGKDQLLGRLEEISPGITMKIRQLKAVEDIQNIHKVGTYTKTALEGAGLGGGILTANVPLIAASIATIILTQPEVAVRMLRAYGGTAVPIAGAVLDLLKKGGGALNNLPQTQAPAVTTGAFGRTAQIAAPAAQ